ncbi:MAG: TRAP transporter substrate-binding protein [Burkholderiaceae bacterium]|jgi:TRAP-type C4-dicarboxylate transport system substrate-binding protein
MRRRIIKGLALAAAVAAVPMAQAQPTLVFGGSDAVGTVLDRTNAMFTRLVNERAAGKVKINFIQGEQLGSDVQVIEQMMKGSVAFYGDVLDWYSNWVKDFSVLAWGFTFRDNDHFQKFIESPTFMAMAEELRVKQGLRILAAAPSQPRILFAKKAVQTPDDLKDVKMRVPEIKTYLNLWQAMGTKPARVAWAEVFLGLKTGVIDAAEGPIGSAYAQKFHNAAPSVMRTDHLLSSMHITVNDKVFAALPADVQKIMVDAAREAVAWGRKEAEAETEDVVKKMAAEGAKVVSVNRAPFADRALSAVEAMEKDGAWSTGLYKRISDIR